MIVEYLLERNLATLKQALAVLPVFGSLQQMNQFAEAIHAWRKTEEPA
jgi:hypothetical protein